MCVGVVWIACGVVWWWLFGVVVVGLAGLASDEKLALEWWERAAQLGLPAAQVNVGLAYEQGQLVQQDLQKAVQLFERAARGGSSAGQELIGLAYLNGFGVQPDAKVGLQWLEKSAKQGQVSAVFMTGLCYLHGMCVAGCGCALALGFAVCSNVCNSNANALPCDCDCDCVGNGVPKDGKMAVAWLTASATQGNARAQHTLATCFEALYSFPPPLLPLPFALQLL